MSVKLRNRDEALRLLAFAEQRHGYPLAADLDGWKDGRSDPQNRYLFGVCYPLLVDAKGYEKEEIHEWMCGQHFGWKDVPCPKTPNNPEGVKSVPMRTTTRNEDGKRDVLDVVRFGLFVEMVQRIGAQAGVFIPDPDPSDMQQSKPRRGTTATSLRKASA